ncbi:MAG: ABC transporter permease [Fimbriimonadaceae bacterium]|nr:ABC transporter permease [Fimbriimonadaceae bacterium]QYK55393.1 MAG: ABC transporter permease [Fimbriimonadaceae bacterium]
MGVWESVRVAFDMLRLHKLRAFLTMLGVIIGVMSVTLIVMVSGGFQHFLTYEIKKLGSDTIIVFFDPSRMKKGEAVGGIEGLTMDDVHEIESQVSSIEIASPIYQVPLNTVKNGDRTLKNARIMATDEKQAELSRVAIEKGRHMTKRDIETSANVCVVGDEVVSRLFQKEDPLGKLVTFQGITLEVVGVMARVDIMGQTNGRDVWVPVTTTQQKWMGGKYLSYITARPKEGFTVQQAMDDVWRYLMRKSGNKEIYRVDSRESIIAVLGGIVVAAGVLLSGVAALSLLVGGIGIMNIMLVSVTERTREIGLRKAVGAPRMAVLTQFLVESAILSLVGGLIGMGLAFLVGQLITFGTAQAKWPAAGGLLMPFPITVALIAAGFSALIGVVFGIYPAARAAGLSPIEALRTE